MPVDTYGEALRIDADETAAYHLAAYARKSRQQAFLEELLAARGVQPVRVLDLCSGGGAASAYLAASYPRAHFTLVDSSEQACAIARERLDPARTVVLTGDFAQVEGLGDPFDLVLCLQSLSFVTRPRELLERAIALTAPGGLAVLSSLYNLDCDVDLRTEVVDRSRASAAAGLTYRYDTFSALTLSAWVAGRVAAHEIVPFEMDIDLAPAGRGLGSYTVARQDGGRLTISGGMLMRWGFLILRK